MSEHDEVVERQRLLLEAEEWAKGVTSLHAHSMTSMYYETEESKTDFEQGSVTDVEYNSGIIVRSQNGKVIRTFGKRLVGEDLVDLYSRKT
jgi:hypothetical protein